MGERIRENWLELLSVTTMLFLSPQLALLGFIAALIALLLPIISISYRS